MATEDLSAENVVHVDNNVSVAARVFTEASILEQFQPQQQESNRADVCDKETVDEVAP